MELRQLEYLVAIAEEGSFTRAALRVHVAQPAVSQQIRQLERDVGDRLLDRSDRPIRLTAAGAAFLPYARAVLSAVRDGRDAVASLTGTLTGRLTVGTVQAPPPLVLDLLGRFQERFSGVEIAMRVGHAGELAAQVGTSSLDLAVIGLGGQRLPATVRTRPLTSEPVVLAVSMRHPFAGRASVTVARLRDQPLVTLPAGSGLRALVEAACAKAGFAPQVRTETDDVFLLADLARHGLGVALLPQSVVSAHTEGLHLVAVQRPTLHRKLALAWPATRCSATAAAFLGFASDQLQPVAGM